jgi:hypothetical protein
MIELDAIGAPRRRVESSFFPWLSAAIVAFVFVGFARTYFLAHLFGVAPPKPLFVFHGALMSGWVVLLMIQSWLASIGRVRWHRLLGTLGVLYAALIVVVGCIATLSAAAREVNAHSAFVTSQLDVLALELMQMVLFGSLVSAAVIMRKRPEWHKRLMVMATLCTLPNVIVRIGFVVPAYLLQQNYGILIVWALLVLFVIALDTLLIRRIHPAFRIAACGAVIALSAAYFIGISATWVRIGTALSLLWAGGRLVH